MVELYNGTIVVSGKTAENFQRDVGLPPRSEERDRYFAHLDAMNIVENSHESIAVELSDFDTSFLQENQDVQTTMILFDRTPKKKVMHYTKPTEEIRFETPLDVYIKLTYNDIDAKKFCSNDSVSMNFCNIYGEKYGEKSEWQNIIGMSDDVA